MRVVRRLIALLVVCGVGVTLGAPGAGAQTSAPIDIDLTPDELGLWVTYPDGTVVTRGTGTPHYGDRPTLVAGDRIVALAPTSGSGYWLFSSNGAVFAFGDADYHGGVSHLNLAASVIAGVPTPSGDGYYMLGSDGGIFAFGDAVFRGSLPDIGVVPNSPVVSMSATPDGYLLVAADGGTFAFGAAGFHGSLPGLGIVPGSPIVDLVPGSAGYLMLGADGGIFNFGDSNYLGSLVGFTNSPAVSVAVKADLTGYVTLTADGTAWPFGDARSAGAARVTGFGTTSFDLGVPPKSIVRASHSGAGAFTVWVTDSGGAKLTRLVDESGASDGRYWVDSSNAARFEVTASGAWAVEVAPLHYSRKWHYSLGPATGLGSDVLAIPVIATSSFAADMSGAGTNQIFHHRGNFLLVRDVLVSLIGPVVNEQDPIIATPVISHLEVQTASFADWTMRIS